jgi:hypothetical protein
MAQAERRPAFGELGTLTPAEVQERVELAIQRALQETAGNGERPGAAYSQLCRGPRRGHEGDGLPVSTELAILKRLLTSG